MVILQPCSGINRCCCVCVMKHVCMHSRFPVSAVFSSAHGSDKSNHSEFSWSVLSGQTAGMSVMIWVHGTDKAAPWAGHVWADWCRHRGKMVLANMETNEWEDNIWKRLRKTSVDILYKETVINKLGQCQWLCWLLTTYNQNSVNAIYVTLNSALCRLILYLQHWYSD